MPAFITPTEVTVGAAAAWTDVDLSALIPAGATGVMFHVVNVNAGTLAFGARKNGSTDNRTNGLGTTSHAWGCIGVDGSRIVEFYVESTTDIDIYIVGYFGSEAVFFTNAVDKSTANTSVWEDVNISGDTGADTAIAAIVEFIRSTASLGLRKNGSTDSRIGGINLHGWALVGVDASEIFEQQITTANGDIFLVGYLKDGVSMYDNGIDRSLTSVNVYTDLPALPSGAIGGIYESEGSNSSTRDTAFRKNGSAEDLRYMLWHNWALVECDASRIVEHNVESTSVDTWEIGYFFTVSGGETFKRKKLLLQG